MSKPQEPSASTGSCPYAGLGHQFNPLSGPEYDELAAFFTQARREEPVFFSPTLNMWVVSRYEAQVEILKDTDRFTADRGTEVLNASVVPEARELLAQSHVFTSLTMGTSDAHHARLRAPFAKFFSPQRIKALEPRLREYAESLVDGFAATGRADVIADFSYQLPLMVIRDVLGVPREDLARVQEWCIALADFVFSVVPPERQVERLRQILDFEHYLSGLIARYRAAPGDNMISAMLSGIASGEEQMSEGELLATLCLSLVASGHETVAKTLGNSLRYLLTHRERWQQLIDEPELIPDAIEESLRLYATVMGFFRIAREEVEVGGVRVPKGAPVFLLFASANHDEAKFPAPLEYNPRRENLSAHLGFSRGLHYCLGAPLARLEMRVALEVLTRRLPGLRLVPDQELRYVPSVVLRGLKHLHVEWDPAPAA